VSAGHHATLEFCVDADDRCIRHVRVSVVSFVMVLLEHRELASRMGMVSAELAEHAIRVANGGDVRARLSLRKDVHTGRVKVEAVAECRITPQTGQRLAAMFEVLQKGSGMDAYLRALAQTSTENQVGLARVRYEGQMALRYTVEANVLKVYAESDEARPAESQTKVA